MANHGEIVSFIWGVADLIRDSFKRGHYQDVILPFTVLRRIDSVLATNRQKVHETYNKLKGKLENLDPQLCKASGFAFYNTSKYNFKTLLDEPQQLAANLRAYINGFSKNMADVIEKFDFPNTITKLETANLLYRVVERFAEADLSPSRLSNHEMGYVFEELIRKFNEALDENPGEHFTPREVIRLMVNLMTSHDRKALEVPKVGRTVYDPCCGSGGMLTTTKSRIQEINSTADVHLFGQEVNPQTFAVSKSDLYIKSADGRDAENIAFGSVLSQDGHADRTFDYLLSNPPYGKDWNLDQEFVRAEAARATKNRFVAGLPRISDGQLLFLQHMLGRMHHPSEGTSRVSIIMNGSPLFTGDAGSGESEIRRWILEKDYLEALIALPQQLFYNTGISTYVWVLTNNKPPDRKGKVQLIDASEAWLPRRKSLGDKRRDIPDGVERTDANYIPDIVKLFEDFTEGSAIIPGEPPKEIRAKVFPTTAFGYRKVTIERPLRLNFQATPERIARIEEAKAFQNLAVSKKKDPRERAADEALGRESQEAIREMLKMLPGTLIKDRAEFLPLFERAVRKEGLRLAAPLKRAILDALSERDETSEICRDEEENPEADSDLRDTENVPLGESVRDYFERKVKPHVPDAWINETIRDEKDGEVGIVGYEINVNRYFYRYRPPRKLEEIELDIKAVEADVLRLLRRQAVISHAVTRGLDPATPLKDLGIPWLGMVPQHWSLVPLKHLSFWITSGSRGWAEYYSDDGPLFLRIGNLRRNSIELRLDDIQRVTPPKSSEGIRTRVEAGDLLVSITAFLGAVGIIPPGFEEAYVNQHIALVRPKSDQVYSEWLGFFLLSDNAQVQFPLLNQGGTKEGLSLGDVGNLQVLLPPKREQAEILSFIKKTEGPIFDSISRIRDGISFLHEYRTALISAAVTGQIDVRDEVSP